MGRIGSRRRFLALTAAAGGDEVQHARAVLEILDARDALSDLPMLALPNGEKVELSASLVQALHEAARAVAEGDQSVRVVGRRKELTTSKAAELIGVSRPHLIFLLDRESVPYRKVGTHRRIALDDLLTMKRRMEERAGEALRKMVDLSAEAGLYERDDAEVVRATG